MYTFKELRKASKKEIPKDSVRLAVLGNTATQFFSTAVTGCCRLRGLNLSVYDAPYDQIDAQLIDPGSETYAFDPHDILLYLSSDRLYEDFLKLPLSERSSFAEACMDRIRLYWELIAKNSRARIIQMNFTETDDKALGQYSCKVSQSFTFQIRKLNHLLQEAMEKTRSVYPVDILSVQLSLGRDTFYDPALYYNAKMPVALNALPAVAEAVSDVLLAMSGRIIKCVIMDLDNTIWGGVIGDDGLAGIEIGELGRGHAFTDLQRWLKQLKDLGIILAVCSKNNEEVAKEPFEKHDEMVLRLSDISLFVANWDDKATNIRMIQETLNIGMDSILFLDDNPFERNLVRESISAIEVPELPEDPALYLSFLQKQNYFETVSYEAGGSDRTGQYQAEYERRKSQASFTDLEDYLKSLEMVGEARPFEEVRYPRIAQLTQRSNQFNLRTVRYTEDQIARIAADDRYLTLYYTLKDRFGDHGLVSVVIMEKLSDTELFIDTWLMSCRVLKRGMEEFIVNELMELARREGFSVVTGEYLPTAKNRMVEHIYEDMGFVSQGNGRYSADTGTYVRKKNFIEKRQEV